MNTLSEKNFCELSIFRCQLCKLRLNSRIMQIDEIGAICKNCYERGVFTHAIRNVGLEEDMSKLNFACRYQNRGCIFEASFLTTSSHEARCSFRDRKCPLAHVNECEHNLISDLMFHFRQKHFDRILEFEDKLITIQYPVVSEKCETIYLIKLKYKYFLLRIKFHVHQQTILFAFYYFGNCSENSHFTFVVSNQDFDFISRKLSALHESELENNFNESHGLKVNLSMINLNDNKLPFVANYEDREMTEALKHFECPVCFNFMIEEIHICTNGHSICYKCKHVLNECPSCQSNFSGRNYSLESLSSVIKFPCKNSDDCGKFIPGNQYKHHSLECFYETYGCPFAKTSEHCVWEGIYSDLLIHLQDNHDGLLHKSGDKLMIPVITNINYIRCFILENDIMICSYALNDDFTIALDSHLFKGYFNTRLICKVFIGEHHHSNGCVLKFSIPFYCPNGVDITSYASNGELQLTFVYKRTEDEIED